MVPSSAPEAEYSETMPPLYSSDLAVPQPIRVPPPSRRWMLPCDRRSCRPDEAKSPQPWPSSCQSPVRTPHRGTSRVPADGIVKDDQTVAGQQHGIVLLGERPIFIGEDEIARGSAHLPGEPIPSFGQFGPQDPCCACTTGCPHCPRFRRHCGGRRRSGKLPIAVGADGWPECGRMPATPTMMLPFSSNSYRTQSMTARDGSSGSGTLSATFMVMISTPSGGRCHLPSVRGHG